MNKPIATLPIPLPAFAEVAEVFRMYIRPEDEKGASFINKNFIHLASTPTDARGQAVHKMHKRFRFLGKCYGDLLKPPHEPLPATQDIQKIFAEYSAEKADTITLYFDREGSNPQPVTIPNRKIGGELDAENTIGQTLFLLGLAGKEIESRSEEESQFIVTHLGQADFITHRMCFVYKYIYSALRTQGYGEDSIGEMFQKSNLDIDKNMVPFIIKSMGEPKYRESPLVF